MPFDFKKEYKAFYQPPKQPQIVTIPAMPYIGMKGKGDPNEAGGEYQRSVECLYATAYTLKMSKNGDHRMDGYFDYVVPPLEGLWHQEGIEGMDYTRKDLLRFTSLLRLPDFVQEQDVLWAIDLVKRKKGLDCSAVEFLILDEGLCVQALHIGPYDTEPQTVGGMHAYVASCGYVLDFSGVRLHHEIYLSDPRKTEAEKRKTVIRHPIATQ